MAKQTFSKQLNNYKSDLRKRDEKSCTNCLFCYNCIDCDNCYRSNQLRHCENCTLCVSLEECDHCYRSDDCYQCIGLRYCHNCELCLFCDGLSGTDEEYKMYYVFNKYVGRKAFYKAVRQAVKEGVVKETFATHNMFI